MLACNPATPGTDKQVIMPQQNKCRKRHFLTVPQPSKQTHFPTNARMTRKRCSLSVQRCRPGCPGMWKNTPTTRCGYGSGTMTLSSGSGTCSQPRIAYSLNRECEISKYQKRNPKKEIYVKGTQSHWCVARREQLVVQPIIRHPVQILIFNNRLRQTAKKKRKTKQPLQLSTRSFRIRIRPWQPLGTVIIMWVKSPLPAHQRRDVCASRGSQTRMPPTRTLTLRCTERKTKWSQ